MGQGGCSRAETILRALLVTNTADNRIELVFHIFAQCGGNFEVVTADRQVHKHSLLLLGMTALFDEGQTASGERR